MNSASSILELRVATVLVVPLAFYATPENERDIDGRATTHGKGLQFRERSSSSTAIAASYCPSSKQVSTRFRSWTVRSRFFELVDAPHVTAILPSTGPWMLADGVVQCEGCRELSKQKRGGPKTKSLREIERQRMRVLFAATRRHIKHDWSRRSRRACQYASRRVSSMRHRFPRCTLRMRHAIATYYITPSPDSRATTTHGYVVTTRQCNVMDE